MEEELKKMIWGMTPEEREAFRKMAGSAGNRPPRYLELFEDILSEAKVTSARNNRDSVLRRYLREAVVRSLTGPPTGIGPDAALRHRLAEIETLAGRGLPRMVTKRVQKGLAAARESGLPRHELAFLEWERRLLRASRNPARLPELERIAREQQAALEAIAAEVRLLADYDQLFMRAQTAYSSGAAPELSPGLPTPSTPPRTSFNGSLAFFTNQGIRARMAGDNRTALSAFRSNLEVWHAFPRHISAQPRRYAAATINYLSACTEVGEWSEFDRLIQSLASNTHLKAGDRHHLLLKIHDLRLTGALNQQDLGTARQEAREVAALLGAHRFEPVLEISCSYNLAVQGLLDGDNPWALRWTHHILNHPRSEERKDLRLSARILEIILHFERGDHELIGYRIRMVQRLHRAQGLPAWVLPLLTGLRLAATPLREAEGKMDLRAWWQQTWAAEGRPGRLEIRAWVGKWLTGRPIAELLREASEAAELS